MTGVANVLYSRTTRRISNQRSLVHGLAKFGAVVLLTGSAACTAHSGAMQNSIAFSCAISGVKFADATLDNATVCALFKAKVEAALDRKTTAEHNLSVKDGGDAINLDIRYTKLGSVIATIVEKSGSINTHYPEISVDVSDRPIGQQDVNLLATEVARVIAEKRK